MMMKKILRRISISAAGFHLAVSFANVSYAIIGGPNDADSKISISQKDATDIQKNVLRSIKDIYSGNGVENAKFSTEVIFRDPVAICEGIDEVAEAFRALKVISPKIMEEPKLFLGRSDKELYVKIRTSYNCIKPFTVNSMCIIETGEDGNIISIEELWNFVPLIDNSFFMWSKRLNGLISYRLTRFLIS